MNDRTILPFYMTYPYPVFFDEQDRMLQDLEYMQQIYPDEARSVLRRIIKRIEPYDYKGSIIYDEYPDRLGLFRIATAVLDEIREEEKLRGNILSKEKEIWLLDLITLALYQEIIKRRYERKNGYLRF